MCIIGMCFKRERKIMRVSPLSYNYSTLNKQNNNIQKNAPAFKSTFFIIGEKSLKYGNYCISELASNVENFLNGFSMYRIFDRKKGYSIGAEIVIIQLANGRMTERAHALAEQMKRDSVLKKKSNIIKFGVSLEDLD